MDKTRCVDERESILSDVTATPCELLTLLLEYAGAGESAGALSASLLEKYGSVDALLSQRAGSLSASVGLSDHAAMLVSSIFPIVSRSHTDVIERGIMNQQSQIGKYFVYKFLGMREERVCVLLLDSRSRFIDCVELARGDAREVTVSHGRVAECIASSGAARVAVSHNHPVGYSHPSDADRETTVAFSRLCAGLGVEFIGHFVVGNNNYTLI